jgi:predicted transcriptional regulator
VSDRIAAKAVRPEERSDSIVVSFGPDWLQPLQGRKFTAVIRKRVPKGARPKWIYFHINAPISALCGRAEIRSLDELAVGKVIKMGNELALSPAQIRSYTGTEPAVGCYRLGKIQFPQKPIKMSVLSSHMVYHAPQSFFILSRKGKAAIDKLGRFRPGH